MLNQHVNVDSRFVFNLGPSELLTNRLLYKRRQLSDLVNCCTYLSCTRYRFVFYASCEICQRKAYSYGPCGRIRSWNYKLGFYENGTKAKPDYFRISITIVCLLFMCCFKCDFQVQGLKINRIHHVPNQHRKNKNTRFSAQPLSRAYSPFWNLILAKSASQGAKSRQIEKCTENNGQSVFLFTNRKAKKYMSIFRFP